MIPSCQAHDVDALETNVRQFLAAHHLKLNTDLGQHFLIDEEILGSVVASAGIEPEDHIVEIGPGIGVLTRELLKLAGRVTSIEVDARLLPLLKDFTTPTETPFEIIHGNALQVDFPKDDYKIVANIPYHITSPLLRHAYLEGNPPRSMTLLLQREVAQKIADPENSGLLTILVGLFGTPTLIGIVRPSAFLPPPKVDSAILHIESHKKPIANEATIERIFVLAKHAFSQKRKMLRNSLGSFPDGMELLKCASISPDRRPQTLTIAEWIALAQATPLS